MSQLLPVLAAIAALRARGEGGILLLEQPELHLHPRWQAILAHVLLAEVMEDGEEAAKNLTRLPLQVVVETHSENFVLRLARLARLDGEPVRRAVTVLRFDRRTGSGTTHPSEMSPDDSADHNAWPAAFLGDRMRELFDEERPRLAGDHSPPRVPPGQDGGAT